MSNRVLSNSPSGFSLIELMIVMAVGSIMILGIAQMSSYQARISKTTELDKQLDEIKRQFQTWINNESFCNATFAGLRNGDNPPGIMRSDQPGDFIIQVDDRVPGTDWAIDSFNLLNSVEIGQKYPQYNAGVNQDGVGTGVLRVVLRQLKRGTVNTKLTAGEDTGAFKSIRKELFFPINAKFGDYVGVRVVGVDLENKLKSDVGPADGGVCCATCLIPGRGGLTYHQKVIADVAAAPRGGLPAPPAPTIGAGGVNPFFVQSAADFPETFPSPTAVVVAAIQMDQYDLDCFLYNIDYAIISCVSPGGTSL